MKKFFMKKPVLIDVILKAIQEQKALGKKEVMFSRDSYYDIWLELQASYRIYKFSKGIFGNDFLNTCRSIRGLGFVFIPYGENFIIEFKEK